MPRASLVNLRPFPSLVRRRASDAAYVTGAAAVPGGPDGAEHRDGDAETRFLTTDRGWMRTRLQTAPKKWKDAGFLTRSSCCSFWGGSRRFSTCVTRMLTVTSGWSTWRTSVSSSAKETKWESSVFIENNNIGGFYVIVINITVIREHVAPGWPNEL